jgi:anti-anti-sigma factor
MTRPYRHITVERRQDVFCVRLRHYQMDEPSVYELANELTALTTDEGCRKLALGLGPPSPECMYSVFLAKLVTAQRVLREHGGELVLCGANSQVYSIFEACHLADEFTFLPDFDAAVAHWSGERE